MNNKIAIVDYGMGNLKSVKNALAFLGIKSEVIDSPEKLKGYKGIIIPGVGAFPTAMSRIKEKGFDYGIYDELKNKKPILGICLGMQILFTLGHEVVPCNGLDIIRGEVKKLPEGKVKIPHMGWNSIDFKTNHPLFKGIPTNTQFYFVHSYCVDKVPGEYVLGTTNHGVKFVSAVYKDNVTGLQFHPEKSGKWGLKILENFGEMIKCC